VIIVLTLDQKILICFNLILLNKFIQIWLNCANILQTSFRIRVGRSIQGFGLSPGITKEQRIAVEKLAASALSKLTGNC
jgi:hypothetical protein